MAIQFSRQMPLPEEMIRRYPVSTSLAEYKKSRESELKRVLSGESGTFLLILGPCSADRTAPVLDYAARLSALQEKVSERIFLLPRVYTNKPRSLSRGYLGMMFTPRPEDSTDIEKGLASIRALHLSVLSQTGLITADELLYPDVYPYLSDLVSYWTVGARSSEEQLHRFVASGMEVPVGFKNPTGGNLLSLVNSLQAARAGHTFFFRGWEVESSGNPFAHPVLRGYVTADGTGKSNYGYEDIRRLIQLLQDSRIGDSPVIIDLSHMNSGKDPQKQPVIAAELLRMRRDCADVRRYVKGMMLESYLVDGKQAPPGNLYGCSITDGCLGWEKTERLVLEIAERL